MGSVLSRRGGGGGLLAEVAGGEMDNYPAMKLAKKICSAADNVKNINQKVSEMNAELTAAILQQITAADTEADIRRRIETEKTAL